MPTADHGRTPRLTPAEIVADTVQAFAARDAATLFARVAPEIAVFISDLRSWGGVYEGIAEVHHRLAALLADQELEVRVERISEVAGRIATSGRVRGFVREMGVPFELPLTCIWTVRRDAILGLEIYTGPAATQLLSTPVD